MELVVCDASNYANCDPNLPGSPPGPSQGPYATTGGAIWIQSGSTSPVAVDFDLNLEFPLCHELPRAFRRSRLDRRWGLPGKLLLSNGTAPNDLAAHQSENPATNTYYPGYWGIFDGGQSWAYRGASQAPGTNYTGWYYTAIRAWTGNFNSFAAAVAGGASFAESGPFQTHFGYSVNPENVGDFSNMPSLILRPYLPGDANQDGRVDINDLTIVLTDFGRTGQTWNQGDFNGDGRVDINDLTVVLAKFGRSLGSVAGGVTSVPEPSTVALSADFYRDFLFSPLRAECPEGDSYEMRGIVLRRAGGRGPCRLRRKRPRLRTAIRATWRTPIQICRAAPRGRSKALRDHGRRDLDQDRHAAPVAVDFDINLEFLLQHHGDQWPVSGPDQPE